MMLPKMYGVTQMFDTSHVEDVPGAVRAAFAAKGHMAQKVRPGQSVALLVGSRGIANLAEIVATTIACLKEWGLEPYITPCMGSHGGGTAEGQTELLRSLGVSEESMGVPVRADMAVEVLGQLQDGPGVYFCKEAMKADHVVPIVRIKQHTRLVGSIGSGFCKMLCIGAGKISGAQEYHRYGVEKPLLPAALTVIEKVKSLLCGLCVVENARDEVHTLRVVAPEAFVDTDRELLTLARSMLPMIPLEKADLLLVDRIGKDISGAGADVNVIGKWRRDGGARTPDFDIQAVLDLTEASHGNAFGMGNFDLATKHFKDKVDFDYVYTNAISSTRFRAARLPMIMENDRALLEMVLNSRADPAALSVVCVTSTAELERLWVTENLISALKGRVPVQVDEKPQEFSFDEAGRMRPFA